MTTETAGSPGGASDLDLFEEAATGHSVEKSTAIPEKYAGKSVEDLIQMHQNAERKISEQGREVSVVRRLADEIIGLKKPTTQITEERKPVTVDALLNDPEKAIRDAVANSDVGQRATRAEERVQQLESSITEERFTAKHKTVAQDINDPVFLAWVNKNDLRKALAQRAATKDFVAAQNLWELWDEHKELTAGKAADTGAKGKTVPTTVRQAPLDGVKGKPIYSRAKVMALKMKVQQGDPASLARYNDPTFQENLNQAYADNRVR